MWKVLELNKNELIHATKLFSHSSATRDNITKSQPGKTYMK